MRIGQFQKISIPIPRTAFWNSEGMGGGGGSLNWNLKALGGGSLNWNSEEMEGFSDLGFPEGTDKSEFLKNANFVDLTSSY